MLKLSEKDKLLLIKYIRERFDADESYTWEYINRLEFKILSMLEDPKASDYKPRD